jgi:hypothetical protein
VIAVKMGRFALPRARSLGGDGTGPHQSVACLLGNGPPPGRSLLAGPRQQRRDQTRPFVLGHPWMPSIGARQNG